MDPIPGFVRDILYMWDIQGAVLTSLLLQIVLTFLAPFRKRTKNGIVALLVWFAYLYADSIVVYGIGHISNKYGGNVQDIKDNDYLIAFWAPFLLLHLGGPDTITAFSLEDNELWLRHMVVLIVRVVLTVYVFLLTLPPNTIWLPTALVLLAGIVRISEKIRSLQLASISNFQATSGNQDMENSFSENQKKLEEFMEKISPKEHPADEVVVVTLGYLFNIFKRLDDASSSYYKHANRCFTELTAIDALRVLEVELNFLYETFYTKARLVHRKVGFFFRFVSVSSVMVALVLFVLEQKQGYNEFDVRVTYTLLYCTVALDVVSLLMLIFSDYTFASFNTTSHDLVGSRNKDFIRCIGELHTLIFEPFLKLRKPKWSEAAGQKKILCRQMWCRRWSESISGFNFISYCLHRRKGWVGIGPSELEEWTNEEKNPVCQEHWIFIFKEIQKEAPDNRASNQVSRGARVIEKDEKLRHDQPKWTKFLDGALFYESIIYWHIATNLLFYADGDDVDVENVDHKTDQDHVELHRDLSKLLSDYMLYLLIRQPTIMSAVMESGFQKRWEKCRDEATHEFLSIKTDGESTKWFFTRGNPLSKGGMENNEMMKEARNKLCRSSNNFLKKSEALTRMLKDLERTHRWKTIAQVWVELLSYAASKCRSMTHVQELSNGGEFISLVWLLLAHFGLVDEYQGSSEE